MNKPKPTHYELVQASRNKGKLPKSYIDRLNQWKSKQAEIEKAEAEKDSEPENDQVETEDQPEAEYPQGGSGGWWTLSNGKKFQGSEEDAKAKQAEIDAEG